MTVARTPTKAESISLVAWVAFVVVMLAIAPEAPAPEAVDADAEAARARMVGWAVRDADRWHEEWGDIVVPWDQAEGHLAVVIDDVGRELYWHQKLQALRYRLTFSVLPDAIYASGAQLRLRADHRRYREILLHLPMEPMDDAQTREGPESREDFLLAEDSTQELAAKVERALDKVPGAVGVNNHMGSRLTTDAAAMDAVMSVLARRGKFFLDSRTTAQTEAERAARRAGILSGARHVFLDHEPGEAAVRRALAEAVARSREDPTVAIAHPSAEVVKVLSEDLPGLAESGVAIYPLSELLRPRTARSALR